MKQIASYKGPIYRLKGGVVGYNQYIKANRKHITDTNTSDTTTDTTDTPTAPTADNYIPMSSQSTPPRPLVSLFKGLNYVFDGRMVEQVTDDILGTCGNCGVECNLPKNCHYCNVSV